MRKLLIPSALLAAAFVCSPLALAGTTPAPGTSTATSAHTGHRHHHHMHHRMHHRGHGMYALKKLDLTDSQRTSIHQLMRESFKQARAGRSDLRQKRMAFGKATPGSTAYQNAANDLAKAEAGAAQARVMQWADLNTKIYNLLTTEQRTKLADIRAQRKAKMEKWRASHKHAMTRPATAASTAK